MATGFIGSGHIKFQLGQTKQATERLRDAITESAAVQGALTKLIAAIDRVDGAIGGQIPTEAFSPPRDVLPFPAGKIRVLICSWV